jgi:hypothetical protein
MPEVTTSATRALGSSRQLPQRTVRAVYSTPESTRANSSYRVTAHEATPRQPR